MTLHSKYRLASPMEARFRERDMQRPAVFRCDFCAAWTDGPAEHVLLFAREHREINHPAAVDRGQKARQVAAKNAPVAYWSSRYEPREM